MKHTITQYDYQLIWNNRRAIRDELESLNNGYHPKWSANTGRVYNVFPTAEQLREYRAHLLEAVELIERMERIKYEKGNEGLHDFVLCITP